MQSQSQLIADQSVYHILETLKSEIHVRKLCKYIPQYNKNYITKTSHACVSTAYLQKPLHTVANTKINSKLALRNTKQSKQNQFVQDQVPANIGFDEFANGQMKSVVQQEVEGSIIRAKQQKTQRYTRYSNMYKKTSSEMRATSMTKYKKVQSNPQFHFKPHKLPNADRTFEQLQYKQLNQEEKDLQMELQSMKKKLYYMRSQKKRQEQQQKIKLQEQKKKRSPQPPRTDYTYSFDGKFIQRNKKNTNKQLAQNQLKASYSFDLKPKTKKTLAEFLQSSNLKTNGHRGTSQSQSRKRARYQKNINYNNGNNRQLSHLPFLKMSDNSKITESGRNSEGKKTDRTSLKQFEQSMQQISFKHHSELERDRSNKQLKLKQQQVRQSQQFQQQHQQQQYGNSNVNELLKSQSSTNPMRRQSYLMQKYLKKLKQQQQADPLLNQQIAKKSYNFSRVNFLKTSPIHNYYKYDFNYEKKRYQADTYNSDVKVLDGNLQ